MKKTRIGISILGKLAIVLSLAAVVGCGHGSANPPSTQGQQSDITVVGGSAGVTPFVASIQLAGQSVSQLASVTFSIVAKPNSLSKPVNVTWSTGALSRRGYLHTNLINLPIVGLYQNYLNQVNLQLNFGDGSTQQLSHEVATGTYTDPTGVYLSPTVIRARTPTSSLGFSFFIMKSLITMPLIVDTDGEVRWVVPAGSGTIPTASSYFANGQFQLGSPLGPAVTTLQFDGTQAPYPTNLPQLLLESFTHNIDPGPNGLLAEFNGVDDIGQNIGATVAEIASSVDQPPYQTYDMADILSAYMRANGDDPTAFVRPGADWFHVNSSTYDPNDKTVIISSREDFLIKLNYATHDIVWIFGDPTKYWYTFPSLRAKALTLDPGGEYPIGQHSVSITSDGYVMIANDGYGSLSNPAGTSPGVTRTYSEVNAYSIDSSKLTAHQVWNFSYGQSIFSPICGSIYEAPGKTYLVDFATADNEQHARLIGLDSNLNVVFDFQYQSPTPCGAAWNAIPVPLENLQIN